MSSFPGARLSGAISMTGTALLTMVWLDVSNLLVALPVAAGAAIFGWVTVALFRKEP